MKVDRHQKEIMLFQDAQQQPYLTSYSGSNQLNNKPTNAAGRKNHARTSTLTRKHARRRANALTQLLSDKIVSHLRF